MIPEAIYVFTSATFMKKKTKSFKNYYGLFTYRDVPKKAYPYEITIIKENGYNYNIATREKAICDKLYITRPCTNKTELEMLLFEDLRIDEEIFEELDKEVLS